MLNSPLPTNNNIETPRAPKAIRAFRLLHTGDNPSHTALNLASLFDAASQNTPSPAAIDLTSTSELPVTQSGTTPATTSG